MAKIKLPAGLTPDVLILYLIDLGLTLSENDENKIREGMEADAAESDRLTAESEARDEDARRRLAERNQ